MRPIVSHHGRVRLYAADSRAVLASLADNSVDAVNCDPPYALESVVRRFGKEGSKVAGHGTDGLYERSSADFVGEQWDTGEVAHDPAFWREVLRVLKPGGYLIAMSGARTYHRLGCAIEDAGFDIRDLLGWLYGSGTPKSHPQGDEMETALKPGREPMVLAMKPREGTIKANLAKWGTGVLYTRGLRVAGAGQNVAKGGFPSNIMHDGSPEIVEALAPGDRYFYVPKPSTRDRVEGTEHLGIPEGKKRSNYHPTVKPTPLLEKLNALICPPGGVILDPFMGSGSTGKAAVLAGFRFIGVDNDERYVGIAAARIEWAAQHEEWWDASA